MRLSVVIPVLNSHKIVDRQIKYWKSLNLKDVEIIIVDDYSTPPITDSTGFIKVFRTDSKLAWTQGLARNLGATKATGEYLLMTDIDHIIGKEAFDSVLSFGGTFMRFNRHLGILDEDGNLKTDVASLKEYGTKDRYLKKDSPGTGIHANTFAIKREVFEKLGGYKKEWCDYGFHPLTGLGDDVYFSGMIRRHLKSVKEQQEIVNRIYVFPNGRFHKDENLNPHGLWHNLHHREERSYK